MEQLRLVKRKNVFSQVTFGSRYFEEIIEINNLMWGHRAADLLCGGSNGGRGFAIQKLCRQLQGKDRIRSGNPK